ncbi:MAG: ATP-binding protein [Hyphomicrobiales bacterium]
MNRNAEHVPDEREYQNLGWVDTGQDTTLDHLTTLACSIFDIPLSFVSIVGKYQPMFKSLNGIDLSKQPTKHSFCSHADIDSDIYVVEDATKDPAHKDNPQSFGSTKIVFYAGYPLTSQNGLKLGALCLIDSKPRKFSKADEKKLANLGRICLATLENSNLRAQTVEHTKTSKRLHDAEDRTAHLGSMIERSSNEFYVIDGATLKFKYANQRALNNLGYNLDELLEKTPLDIKGDMTLKEFAPLLKKLRAGKETQVLYDALHERKNGELYPVDIRLERDFIRTEEVFIAIGMDVTEKKQQEEEVKKLSDLNQAIFDSSETGILSMQAIYDATGEIFDFQFVAANLTVERILGKSTESLIGKTIREDFPQRIEQGIFDKYKQVVKTGEPIVFETYLQETNFHGWHRVSAVPTGNDAVTISFISINKIKSTEIQLQKTNSELRQSNDLLNQFNSIVAHDLKRPLRHMNLFAELLLEDIDNPEKTAEAAHKILISAQQAQHMVRALTEFASVGRHSLIFKTVSISKTIKTVKAELKDKLDLSGTLFPVGDLPSVKGDESLIIQLFTNLVENSIKYRSNTPPLLNLSYREDVAVIYFQLSDNGIGIPPNQATNVFRMFQRLPGGLHQKGDGVGLAICQRIIQAHGGKIWVDTDYSEGTSIHFSLPKVIPNDEILEA